MYQVDINYILSIFSCFSILIYIRGIINSAVCFFFLRRSFCAVFTQINEDCSTKRCCRDRGNELIRGLLCPPKAVSLIRHVTFFVGDRFAFESGLVVVFRGKQVMMRDENPVAYIISVFNIMQFENLYQRGFCCDDLCKHRQTFHVGHRDEDRFNQSGARRFMSVITIFFDLAFI